MLAGFAKQGCGGVFVHPRPGLQTEYLSPRWFALWRYAAERCAALGLACQIYDENSFPSGFAGGHVVAAEPQRAGRMLRCEPVGGGVLPAGTVLGCVDLRDGSRMSDDAWRGADGRHVAALTIRPIAASPWYAWLPQPDISLPGAGNAFIATTHDAYAREVGGHFRTDCQLVFTDEPTLVRADGAMTWSEPLAEAFMRRHGRPLAEVAGLLFVDGPGHQSVRHDYHATLARMLEENYFRPIHDWCATQGLAATGHVDEHLWPDPSFLPSSAAALRWMQVPGNDLLAFQFDTAKREDAETSLYRMNLRELDSVARQCGRSGRLVESCGGGGYTYGPAQMKRLEDWAMTLGTDVISPHLAHVSLAGARKYEWPQSMSDHSPWWCDYRPHADHLARVVAALRGGEVERRVLVLMPTTTAWIHARPGAPAGGALGQLKSATLHLLDTLEAAGIDYDLGDEIILAELARVEGRCLQVGHAAYQAIVLPAALGNLEPTTLDLLAQALVAGIPVHAEAACRPAWVAGRPDRRSDGLAASLAWRDHADAASLAAALRRDFTPHLLAADGGPLPAALAWRVVHRGGDTVVFLCNPWNESVSTSLRMPGSMLTALDTADGTLRPVPSRLRDGGQVVDLVLQPGEHVLWRCSDGAVAAALPAAWQPLPVALSGIRADHPNLLTIDHLALRIASREELRTSTVLADRALWKAMGFVEPAWSASIQHRRTFLEHPTDGLPGFRAVYTVMIDAGLDLGSVRLAVERPHLYQVLVNGQAVEGWTRWFDRAMAAAPVDGLLRHGENRIELVAERFHMLHELAPVYLLGDFALRPIASGFALAAPQDFALGLWRDLGRPLANGTMSYHWAIRPETPVRRLQVSLPRWHGAVWRLLVDGVLAGRSVHGASILECDCALQAGAHDLAIDIVSHPAGMLGPHHVEGLPGRWTWERPCHPPSGMAPPGAAWRAPDTGLLEPPVVRMRGLPCLDR